MPQNGIREQSVVRGPRQTRDVLVQDLPREDNPGTPGREGLRALRSDGVDPVAKGQARPLDPPLQQVRRVGYQSAQEG